MLPTVLHHVLHSIFVYIYIHTLFFEMENSMDQVDESINLQPMFDKTSNTNEISTSNSSLIAERNFTSFINEKTRNSNEI